MIFAPTFKNRAGIVAILMFALVGLMAFDSHAWAATQPRDPQPATAYRVAPQQSHPAPPAHYNTTTTITGTRARPPSSVVARWAARQSAVW